MTNQDMTLRYSEKDVCVRKIIEFHTIEKLKIKQMQMIDLLYCINVSL